MRQLSQVIQDVLKSEWAETKQVVEITIPEQIGAVSYPETTLYLANGEGVAVNGRLYENRLRKISSVKFSLSKTPDEAQIIIENVSRDLGFTLSDFRRALDGSRVEIKQLFKANGVWEPDTIFIGQIRDVRVNQEAIELSVNSDMSKRGTSVAGRTITQRCLFRFNVNGSGIGPLCGWSIGQPGNPLSCDKGLDTVNGCQSHGNQHRFGGVPSFTNIDAGNGYEAGGGGIGSGWGDGSGGGWCISLQSWVLCERDGVQYRTKAHNIHKGDYLVSLDKGGKVIKTKVVNATVGNTSTLYVISTENKYILSCSPTHNVMQDLASSTGVPVNTLKEGDSVLSYNFSENKYEVDVIHSIEKIKRSTLVLLLELEAPNHLFLAGDSFDGYIISHNLKPYYTTGDTGVLLAYNVA